MTAPDPPGWLDELDLHVGPPDAAMGTRTLDLDDWFVVDDDWEPPVSYTHLTLPTKRIV